MTPTESQLRETIAGNRVADDKAHAWIAELESTLINAQPSDRVRKQKQLDVVHTQIAHRARETAAAEQRLADLAFEAETVRKMAEQLEPLRLRAQPPDDVIAAKAGELLEAMLAMHEIETWLQDASGDANRAQLEAERLLHAAGVAPRTYAPGQHPVQATTYDALVTGIRHQLELRLRERGIQSLTATQRWNTFGR